MTEDEDWQVDILLKSVYNNSMLTGWSIFAIFDEFAREKDWTYEALLDLYTTADKYGDTALVDVTLRKLQSKIWEGITHLAENAGETNGSDAVDPSLSDIMKHVKLDKTTKHDEITNKNRVRSSKLITSPLMKLIERIYHSEAPDIYRRVREDFLNSLMQRCICEFSGWENEEMRTILGDPESDLCYDIVGELASVARAERKERMEMNGYFNIDAIGDDNGTAW